MARAGVTYNQVAEVAVALLGQGRSPTVEQVRIALGTGSSTTIANHLRQWRTNQEEITLSSLKENIPAEMVSMLKGLWERLVNLSEEKISAIQNEKQQTISELQQDLEKYKTNNQRWQKMYEQWQAEKTKLDQTLVAVKTSLDVAEKEVVAAHIREESLHHQLLEKQNRIEELHHLHCQTQENLEHYRESAREQRLLDQQKFDHEKQQLQLEIKQASELFLTERSEREVLKNQYNFVSLKCDDIESKNFKLKEQCQQLRERLEIIEQEKAKYYHASEHWQRQYKEIQLDNNEKMKQLNNTQSEIQLLNKELKKTRHAITILEEQNKLSAHEKWLLVQEKAQLEGQLKQTQKMMLD